MRYKIAIVILHYESLEDTDQCIKSLIKYFDGDKVQVIVVDNGSINGKLITLADKYNKNKQIKFIYSEKNLGFAKGNNLGYIYAKNKLYSDIIVLANNDLIFKQEGFIDKLIKIYEERNFDVAGPRIISLVDGKNQNPVGLVYNDTYEVTKRINKFKILNLLSYVNLDKLFKKLYGAKIEEYTLESGEDFQLHGACMFFANEYLKKYDGLCDKTFMYGEEFILKYIVKRDDMKMDYIDELEVLHKEGSSTQKMWGKGKKQRQFFYKWSIKSLILLRKMMNSES